MYKRYVKLQVKTWMFSYGKNKKNTEFRITELKALLRSAFREFFEHDKLDEKLEFLFGSTKKKSPVSIRLEKNSNYLKKEDHPLIEHKKGDKSAIKPKTEIEIIFLSYREDILDLYMDILTLASVAGGLGKRTRKGLGAFKISSIKKDLKNSDGINLDKSIDDILNIDKRIENYTFKVRKSDVKNKGNGSLEYKFSLADMKDIHYVKSLYVVKIVKDISNKDNLANILKQISELTHERIANPENLIKSSEAFNSFNLNKDILGNFRGKGLSRFASPVCVSFYDNYMIIKELNYNYIYTKGKLHEKDLDKKYVEGYIEKLKNIAKEKQQ